MMTGISSVYDFDEGDPPLLFPASARRKHNESLFQEYFCEKRKGAKKLKDKNGMHKVSVVSGKRYRGKRGRKASSRRQVVETVSDDVETNETDSLQSEGAAEQQQGDLGNDCNLVSDIEMPKVVFEGVLLEFVQNAELVTPSACITFMANQISLEITWGLSHKIITWPLNEIDGFCSTEITHGDFVLLDVNLTDAGTQTLKKVLEDTCLEIKCDDCLKVEVASDDYSEPARKITSLSDDYKKLYRPSNMESDCTAETHLEASTYPAKDGFVRCSCMNHRPWQDLVFPKGDKDAVTVTIHDYQLLRPHEFLSDTIIDFYIKYLQSRLADHCKERFHFFNSFFFRKLTEFDKSKSPFECVKRWTAKLNIFEKDYLIIPIMQSAHWSLIIICNPGCFSSIGMYEASTSNAPLVMHFDSLKGFHTGIEEPIQNYLIEAWNQVKGNCFDIPAVQFHSAQAPQQTNFSDCGLFLLHYIELFVNGVQNKTFLCHTDVFKYDWSGWFNPEDASCKREVIKDVIEELVSKEFEPQEGWLKCAVSRSLTHQASQGVDPICDSHVEKSSSPLSSFHDISDVHLCMSNDPDTWQVEQTELPGNVSCVCKHHSPHELAAAVNDSFLMHDNTRLEEDMPEVSGSETPNIRQSCYGAYLDNVVFESSTSMHELNLELYFPSHCEAGDKQPVEVPQIKADDPMDEICSKCQDASPSRCYENSSCEVSVLKHPVCLSSDEEPCVQNEESAQRMHEAAAQRREQRGKGKCSHSAILTSSRPLTRSVVKSFMPLQRRKQQT